MNKIIKVTSNIKSPGGVVWAHVLGDLNILVGPNESGKSAIAEAVQLAVSGSAYGLFFRSAVVKSGTQLVDLGPGDDTILFAEVEFEDGTTSRWEMAAGKRPKQTGQTAIALPIAQLRSILSGSAQKARAFFADALLPSVGRGDLEAQLKHAEYDLSIPLEGLLPDQGADITGETLSKLPTQAASAKRKAQGEAKAAQAILKTFNIGDKVENEDIYNTWKSLFKSLRFEWAKKMYKASDVPEEKEFLKNLALSLGTKADLKDLAGSAQYSEELEVLMQDAALYGAASRARSTIKESQRSATEYGVLAEKLDAATLSLLKKPLEAYAKRVNKYLPKGDKFSITHTHTDFKICLVRGKQKHTALSGSSEARTLAAMGAALSSGDRPAVLILDDRMWDTETLARTMGKLEGAPCQVILMTTVSPRGRNRSAWTRIDVARVQPTKEVEDKSISTSPITAGDSDALSW